MYIQTPNKRTNFITQLLLVFLNALLQACSRACSVWGVLRASLFHWAILKLGPPGLPYYPSLFGAGLAAVVVHAVALFLYKVVVLGGLAGTPEDSSLCHLCVYGALDWLVEQNNMEQGGNIIYLWKVRARLLFGT
jgi:hypothetical protein